MNKESLHPFWTLISTLIISIGAGHGVAPIVMIQFWFVISFSTASEIWLLPVLLFSLGQITLIISIFVGKNKKYYYFGGSFVIFIGVLSLILLGLEDYNSELPTLITMIPFTILVLWGFFKEN
ncbi:MAG: hypothetical protein ROO71_13395 [Balneola sp.]